MEIYIIYEIIGYVASVLIAVSLMMTAIIKLRVINLIGAATFSIYGILIGSIPVAAMNGFIVLINVYFLTQMFSSKEYFKLLQVKPGSHYLHYFISFYEDDIRKTQPDFKFEPKDNMVAVFVLRDMVPAGLILGELSPDGTLHVKLDYVIRNYRDFKIGRYVYGKRKDFFKKRGIKKLVSRSAESVHNKYLERMGFVIAGNQYELELK